MLDRASPTHILCVEAAVARAIRSGWVAPLDPEVESFEQDVAELTRRRHAVAPSLVTAGRYFAVTNLGAVIRDVGPSVVVKGVPAA
jgi:dTDP-4-amino-4,6-dideoxygalactose transaminase